jgi:hypothetical protein
MFQGDGDWVEDRDEDGAGTTRKGLDAGQGVRGPAGDGRDMSRD